MGFPRICALAEIAWSNWNGNFQDKSFADFERRLKSGHLDRLAAQQINFFREKEANDGIAFPDTSSCPAEAKDTNGLDAPGCPPFYIAQHLGDGIVVGKSFATEQEAREFFDAKVCPQFAAMMLSASGKLMDFWGEQKATVMSE